MQPDPKKLISAFLLMAVLIGGGTFFFSVFSSDRGDFLARQNNNQLSGAQNAFSSFNTKGSVGEKISPTAFLINPQNVTERVALEISKKILESNPDGPQTDGIAQFLSVPDVNSLEAFISNELKQELFNSLAYRRDGIKIKTNFSEKDELAYLAQLVDILKRAATDPGAKALEKKEPGVEMAKAMSLLMARARLELSSLEVPETLKDLHVAVVSDLYAQEKIFSSAEEYASDPLKTLFVLGRSKEIVEAHQKTIDEQFEKVIKTAARKPTHSYRLAVLAKEVFSLRKAEAQGNTVPVDCTGTSCKKGYQADSKFYGQLMDNRNKSLNQDLFEWARTLATEILKDKLINTFVKQTINWVNGGGETRFVSDWESYLGDVSSETSLDAIDEVVPTLCGPFQEYALVAQNLSELPGRRLSPNPNNNCSLTDLGTGLSAFHDDFSAGGWDSYLQVVQPEGNLFGSLLLTDNHIKRRALSATESARNELSAGSGFLSQKKCPSNGGPPNSAGKCPDGTDPIVTTPGAFISDSLSETAGIPIDRIVNAEDLTDLVSALVNAVVSRVTTAAVDGILGLSDSGRLDQRSVESVEELSSATCAGLGGEELTRCENEAAGIFGDQEEADELPGTLRRTEEVITLWQSIQEKNEAALALTKELKDEEEVAAERFRIGILKQIIEGAPEIFNTAPAVSGCVAPAAGDPDSFNIALLQRRGARRSEAQTVITQLGSLESLIRSQDGEVNYDEFPGLLGRLGGMRLGQLEALIDQYGSPEEITAKERVATERKSRLEDIKNKAQANLPQECNTPLPLDYFNSSSTLMVNP